MSDYQTGWAHALQAARKMLVSNGQPGLASELLNLRAALAALDAGEGEPTKDIRRCPDCGSTYWNRRGAEALDEAREIGFEQGVKASQRVCLERACHHQNTPAEGSYLWAAEKIGMLLSPAKGESK